MIPPPETPSQTAAVEQFCHDYIDIIQIEISYRHNVSYSDSVLRSVCIRGKYHVTGTGCAGR